jgi:hypothetical protein
MLLHILDHEIRPCAQSVGEGGMSRTPSRPGKKGLDTLQYLRGRLALPKDSMGVCITGMRSYLHEVCIVRAVQFALLKTGFTAPAWHN